MAKNKEAESLLLRELISLNNLKYYLENQKKEQEKEKILCDE